jgi:hypothetical protein
MVLFSYFQRSLKKIATILLLGILLFNWVGYRLLVGYLQEEGRKELEVRLDDNDYDESQLVSIKTPVNHLSYYNASDRFERVDGSIEIDGIKYKYVKRRLFKDSAELLCLPDGAAMTLQAFKNDFVRFMNGISTPAKRPGANCVAVKMVMADPYVVEEVSLAPHPAVIQLTVNSRYTLFFPTSPSLALERPPACPC